MIVDCSFLLFAMPLITRLAAIAYTSLHTGQTACC